jgi:hypothetical protein
MCEFLPVPFFRWVAFSVEEISWKILMEIQVCSARDMVHPSVWLKDTEPHLDHFIIGA